jgi:hypothetical protein
MENPENEILRLYGQSRFDTSIAAAEHLKEKKQITKFDNMIIASGLDFPDALSSTYLAYVKEAPILLVGKDAASIKSITDYANENLNEGGMVYLVGGKGAVPLDVENALAGTVKRLSGKDRYKTNMAVLDEAGVAGEELLVRHPLERNEEARLGLRPPEFEGLLARGRGGVGVDGNDGRRDRIGRGGGWRLAIQVARERGDFGGRSGECDSFECGGHGVFSFRVISPRTARSGARTGFRWCAPRRWRPGRGGRRRPLSSR